MLVNYQHSEESHRVVEFDQNAGTRSTSYTIVREESPTAECDCMRSITRLACRHSLKNPEELPRFKHEMQRHDGRSGRGHD